MRQRSRVVCERLGAFEGYQRVIRGRPRLFSFDGQNAKRKQNIDDVDSTSREVLVKFHKPKAPFGYNKTSFMNYVINFQVGDMVMAPCLCFFRNMEPFHLNIARFEDNAIVEVLPPFSARPSHTAPIIKTKPLLALSSRHCPIHIVH